MPSTTRRRRHLAQRKRLPQWFVPGLLLLVLGLVLAGPARYFGWLVFNAASSAVSPTPERDLPTPDGVKTLKDEVEALARVWCDTDALEHSGLPRERQWKVTEGLHEARSAISYLEDVALRGELNADNLWAGVRWKNAKGGLTQARNVLAEAGK